MAGILFSVVMDMYNFVQLRQHELLPDMMEESNVYMQQEGETGAPHKHEKFLPDRKWKEKTYVQEQKGETKHPNTHQEFLPDMTGEKETYMQEQKGETKQPNTHQEFLPDMKGEKETYMQEQKGETKQPNTHQEFLPDMTGEKKTYMQEQKGETNQFMNDHEELLNIENVEDNMEERSPVLESVILVETSMKKSCPPVLESGIQVENNNCTPVLESVDQMVEESDIQQVVIHMIQVLPINLSRITM